MVEYLSLGNVNHVTFEPDKVPLGQKTTVNVTVEKGFIINNLDLEYYESWPDEQTFYYGSYQDGKMIINLVGVPDYNAKNANFESNIVSDPNVHLDVEIPKVEHVTFIPDKIPVGKITTVQAKADTGYKIKSINIYIANWSGDRSLDANYDSSNGTMTFNLSKFDNGSLGLIKRAQQESDIEQTAPIMYPLPIAPHVTFQPNQAELGKTTKITIVPDKDYTFSKGKGLVLNDKVLGNFQGTNVYNLNLTGYTTLNQLVSAHWDLIYNKPVPKPIVKPVPKPIVKPIPKPIEKPIPKPIEKPIPKPIENKIPIKLNLTNCTSDTTSILENTSKTITLTANDGYYFDDDVISYSYNAIAYTDYYSKILTKANKKNTITVNMLVGGYSDYQDNLSKGLPIPSITAKAIKPDTIPTGTQSINIYDMSDGEINTFMNSVVSTIGTNGIETDDYTQFVNQIYRIPFDIPQENTKNITSVKVGNFNVQVNTKQVNQDKLIINCGTITVKPHYNNANDYNPLECILYLPFTKEIKLNINDIINHDVNITYNIDLLNGETTVVVSTETDEVYTGQFNISTSLEYFGLYENKLVNRLNSTYINNVLQAYIKLVYNKPINNTVSYETYEHGTLKDYHGFTKTSNINLQGDYDYNDIEEINSLLKQGVFIK